MSPRSLRVVVVVESRGTPCDGNSLARCAEAVGLPEFHNRRVQPRGGGLNMGALAEAFVAYRSR